MGQIVQLLTEFRVRVLTRVHVVVSACRYTIAAVAIVGPFCEIQTSTTTSSTPFESQGLSQTSRFLIVYDQEYQNILDLLHLPHFDHAQILLRLLRCLPHSRFHVSTQVAQRGQEPFEKCHGLLPANWTREGAVGDRLHHQLICSRRTAKSNATAAEWRTRLCTYGISRSVTYSSLASSS